MQDNEKDIKNFKFDKAAIELLNTLEKENPRVKNFLIRKYKELPVSPEIEEEAYNYFLANSVIITAMTTYTGSSVFTEFLYNGIPSPSPIDRYILQCKAGKAVKSRLLATEKKLSKIITEYRNKGNVLIGNMGSGPGRDVINVLSAKYRNASNIQSIHIDKDINALKRGKIMTKVQKIDHLVKFIQENFLNYNPSQKFDILVLIGILCPLDAETSITILKTIKIFIKGGGCLIASNVTKQMEKEDPFAYFIMKWMADWKLVFKDEEELKLIYEKAGYKWKEGFRDSYGFHLIGVGTPIS